MKKQKELNDLPKPHTTLKTNLQCSMIIALCFLWTSTGYLSWMYHLLNYAEAASVDWLTEVIGYLFQAVGIFLFGVIAKGKKDAFIRKSAFITCIGADFVFIILSNLTSHLVSILIFGYLMNLFHGIIAGFYLTLLATQVEQKYRFWRRIRGIQHSVLAAFFIESLKFSLYPICPDHLWNPNMYYNWNCHR